MGNKQYNLVRVEFDQAQQPKFAEKRGKKYVEFGENNDYPNYLISLFGESPKHGAIVKAFLQDPIELGRLDVRHDFVASPAVAVRVAHGR